MNFIKTISSSILGAAMLLGLGACNGGEDFDDGSTQLYTDIVTVSSIDNSGVVFTFREKDDSSLITLTSGTTVPGIKLNERIVVSYTATQGHYQSGPIKILTAAATFGKGDTIPELDYQGVAPVTSVVQQAEFARSGSYLNAYVLAFSNVTPTKCAIAVDSSTLGNEYPTAYLMFEPGFTGTPRTYVYYMSYSLDKIFEGNSSVKGLTIKYKSEEGYKEARIERGGIHIKPQDDIN